MTDDDRDKATARRLLDALAARDRETVSSCLTDDVVWWVPRSAAQLGLERPYVGHAAVLDLLCGPRSQYREGTMAWEFHQVLSDGGMVATHSTLRALTAGGVPYENHYVQLYRFVDGLVAEGWEHTDTAYAFARFADGAADGE
jgi:ketosteroid isomerase-like protein